jgi:PAS domain S-box-containing protein
MSVALDVMAKELALEQQGQADPERKIVLELEYYHKDGSTRWLENIISGIRDDRGVLIGVHGVSRDITKRKAAEISLRAAEEKYRSVFDNAQEGIFRATPEGRFIMANPAMAHILGYDSPEELTASITDITGQLYVESGDRKKILEAIEKQGYTKNPEIQFRKKDDSIGWVSLTKHAVRDQKGNILYHEGIIVDVTERKENVERLRKALYATVQTIAGIVETRDPYTAGHQRRVANLSGVVAKELGLSDDQIQSLQMAGIIHDVGKISVPAEILSKPTKLTDIEFSLIKSHAQSGYDILKDIEFPWPIARMVLEHHERVNGSGYPNGLTGDKLLIESKILTVADVVESMSSYRPYRPALGIDKALEEISTHKGVFYDPVVVDACIRLFHEKDYKIID